MIVWRVLYWTNFVLCWVLLPTIKNFLSSAEFTFKGKALYALKIRAIWLSLYAGIVVFYIIYYLVTTGGVVFKEIYAVVMSLCSAWALAQIIVFLSNGLIAVPRALFRRGDIKRRLTTVCCMLVQAAEKIDENSFELARQVRKAQALDARASGENKGYTERLLATIPEEVLGLQAGGGDADVADNTEKENESEHQKIVALARSLRSSINEFSVYTKYSPVSHLGSQQNRLVLEGIFIDDVIYAEEHKLKYVMTHDQTKPREGRLGQFLDKFRTLSVKSVW